MSDHDDVLSDLADEFATRLRNGQSASVSEYAAKYPELADDITDLFPSIAAMEHIGQSTQPGDAATAPGLSPGDVLGDYRIVAEIGRGGMGIVYEAEQRSLSRRVALKVLPPTVFTEPAQIARFQQEAETASRLHHPNIVPIFAVAESEGVHMYAMQRIDGTPVDRWIRERRGRARPHGAEQFEEIARIGADAATALHHAHRHAVLHRDVKPSNLIVDEDGKTWVADFGIAKVLDNAVVSQTGAFVGTLQYASPEQLDGQFEVTSDVYGLGLTLYELLTLRPAREEANYAQLLHQVRSVPVTSPAAIEPEVPADLAAIVAKATSHEPNHRYTSAAALADDLNRFLDGQPVRARTITGIERAWRWCRRNPGTSLSLGTAAAAVFGAAVFGWFAYLSASSALERERIANTKVGKSLEAQMLATERAEANLTRSLEAFDDLFDAVAGRDLELLMSDDDSGDSPRLSTISERDLDILERLLEFYDGFATDNASDPRLGLDRARALRRIGDIHRWLGDPEPAGEAYQLAIDAYQAGQRAGWEFDVVDLALVHKNRGLALVDAAEGRSALESLRRAESLLLANEDASFRSQYELARVYNAMGATVQRGARRGGPRGGSRGGSRRGQRWFGTPPSERAAKHHRDALAIATRLAESDATNPEVRLLAARSDRLLAELQSSEDERIEACLRIEDAANELIELADEFSEVPDYAHELVELYGFLALSGATLDAREYYARLAVEHARGMVEDYGDLPRFADLLSRALRRLGDTLCACANAADDTSAEDLREAAARAFTESSELRTELWQRVPHALEHVHALVATRRQHAKLEQTRGQPEVARDLLDTAIAQVSRFLAGDRHAARRVGPALRRTYEQLASVLDELGDDTLAAEARERARAARRWPGFGRRRPR